MPWSTMWMVVLTVFIDPPGLVEYQWTPYRAGLILLSGAAAFCVNYSGFLVLGTCAPLTHVVLGQAKSAVVILGGAVLFGQDQTPQALLGSAIAVASSGVYAHLSRKAESKTESASRPFTLSGFFEFITSGCSEITSPLLESTE